MFYKQDRSSSLRFDPAKAARSRATKQTGPVLITNAQLSEPPGLV